MLVPKKVIFGFSKGFFFFHRCLPFQEWAILLQAAGAAMLDVTVAVEALAFDQWSDSVPRENTKQHSGGWGKYSGLFTAVGDSRGNFPGFCSWVVF